MGGTLPLGYDRPLAGTHVLQVNEAEAETVRSIFERYLKLGSVHALVDELAAAGIVSKRRVTASGMIRGGATFSRGALFHLLRNPVYLGKITHRGTIHEGSHEAIIDEALFRAVQCQLGNQQRRHRTKSDRSLSRAPLTGRLFDAAGGPMTPTWSRGQAGRTYRYYVAAALQQGKHATRFRAPTRVSAPAIEGAIAGALARLAPSSLDPLSLPLRVTLHTNEIELLLPSTLLREVRSHLLPAERAEPAEHNRCLLTLPLSLGQRGARTIVTASAALEPEPDTVLIGALRKAHRLRGRDAFVMAAPRSPYDRRLLRLAFLAPAIQRDIVAGRQPRHANLEFQMKAEIPLAWAEQHQRLRWPA